MALLLDVFGFLSVVLRGLTVTAQSLTLGGIAFLAFLVVPLLPKLGESGRAIGRTALRFIGWSALALAASEAISVGLEAAILADSAQLSARETLGAGFVVSGVAVTAAALAIAALAARRDAAPAIPLLIGLAVAALVAQAISSHAASRLDDRLPLVVAELAHQGAAAAWVGGIPYLLLALARAPDDGSAFLIGKRFSHIAMICVGVLLAAGLTMAVAYIGSVPALYGTSYGIMVATKAALLCSLLLLGGMNYRIVERLRRDPAAPMPRLRRFAEVEIGIGITLLFAAASLTSLPPAADLAADRASPSEIAARLAPQWPRLSSPDHAALAIPELQAQLDRAASGDSHVLHAFTPGMGELPPRNAEDIAWSEYNHHWAGLIVLAIGLLAIAERTGRVPWARNWPLLFLALAAFLLLRSDPEVWPLGDIGFWDSLRDPEIVQHRVFVVLIVGFAIFEWRVRTGRERSAKAALAFPLITAVGGALLLTHSHALSSLKDQFLIELSHVPLALCGIAAGWTRWLELRLDPPARRIPSWIWPVCFALVGIILLLYREA